MTTHSTGIDALARLGMTSEMLRAAAEMDPRLAPSYTATADRLDEAANENAPDAGQGIEGNENRTNLQEGAASTMTVSNTPALDQWSSLDARLESIDAGTMLPADRRPLWCADITYTAPAAISATMISDPVSVPLRRHPGVVTDGGGRVEPAVAYVDIRQNPAAREPYIHLERWAAVDGKRKQIGGSGYDLTLDEADELANALRLAVAAAREALEGDA